MLRKVIAFGILSVLLFFNACAPSGTRPDKKIRATLALTTANPSEEDINEAISALKRRFEKFNAFPSVERMDSSTTIRFTLDTHAESDRIRNYLTTPGNLEFYPVVPHEELIPFFSSADAWLTENDSLDLDPIVSKFAAHASNLGWVPFYVSEKDTAAIGSYLRRDGVRALLPKAYRRSKFMWGLKDKESENFPLYAVKTTKSGGASLNGDVLDKAYQIYNYQDMPTIGIQMNAEGAAVWERLTGDASENQTLIAIVVDGVVYSAPGVVAGPIKGGRSEINGDFTLEEARDLAGAVGSGAIPKLKILNFSAEPLQ